MSRTSYNISREQEHVNNFTNTFSDFPLQFDHNFQRAGIKSGLWPIIAKFPSLLEFVHNINWFTQDTINPLETLLIETAKTLK